MANPNIGLLIPPTFGPNYCPQGPDVWQNFINDAYANTRVVAFSGSQSTQYFVFGSVKPSVDQQSFPWLRYDPSRHTFRWYAFDIFGEGIWASPHEVVANSQKLSMFEGAAADVDTEDEGAAGTITNTTGPFWEIATEYEGRSPIGAGNVPGTTPTQTIAVGANDGEARHTLLDTELPASFTLTAPQLPALRSTNLSAGGPQWLAPLGSHGAALCTPPYEDATISFAKTGGGQGLNVIHPVRGIYFIRRTARIYYTVP